MNFLVLYHQVPFPPTDGGSVSIYNDLKALSGAGCKVTLVCFNTSKNHKNEQELRNVPDFIHHFYSVPLDNKIDYIQAIKCFFNDKLYHVERYITDEMQGLIADVTANNSFDCVLFQGVFMYAYASLFKNNSIKKILRPQNVEHVIIKKLAKRSSWFTLRKYYYMIILSKFKKWEDALLLDYNAILPLTTVDKNYFDSVHHGLKTKSITALVSKKMTLSHPPIYFKFFHLASMDWQPNIDAVSWWLQTVFPILNSKNTNIKVHFAGKSMPLYLFNSKYENVTFTSFVEDATLFSLSQHVLIVPLKCGSGYRIKILEAFDLGIPVIATTQAIEGIDAEAGVHFLLADSAPSFCEAMINLNKNPSLAITLSNNAKKLFNEKYNLNKEIIHLIDFIKSV